jgi:hypothetical protein
MLTTNRCSLLLWTPSFSSFFLLLPPSIRLVILLVSLCVRTYVCVCVYVCSVYIYVLIYLFTCLYFCLICIAFLLCVSVYLPFFFFKPIISLWYSEHIRDLYRRCVPFRDRLSLMKLLPHFLECWY